MQQCEGVRPLRRISRASNQRATHDRMKVSNLIVTQSLTECGQAALRLDSDPASGDKPAQRRQEAFGSRIERLVAGTVPC